MKSLIILILVTSSLFAQEITGTDLLSLKNNSRVIMQNSSENSYSMNEVDKFMRDYQSEKKSGFTAILYSLLLPGMGELYGGNYDRGKYFTVAEGVFWGFFAGFNIYGNWQRENYKAFAASYGGVIPAGKDDDFYANIGDVNNIHEYNRLMSLDRNFPEMYDTKSKFWDWKTTEQRRRYKDMWISSEQAFNNVRFAVGAMVINRIVSAINAALVVRSYNKKLASPSINMFFNTDDMLTYRLGVSFNGF